jgi:hypothetical protein
VQPSQFRSHDSSRGPHRGSGNVTVPLFPDRPEMDVMFILALLVLYAATHWLVVALARLGEPE